MIGRSRRSSAFSVDLGPGADADPLAREIRRRIVAKLEQGSSVRAFRGMWGTVVIVAVSQDLTEGTAYNTLTLRFDWGRLMIHEGRVGRPDVTLWGTPEGILAWGLTRRWRLPRRFSVSRFFRNRDRTDAADDSESENLHPGWMGPWAALLPRFDGPGEPKLRIYGRLSRPRFVWRLARLLSQS